MSWLRGLLSPRRPVSRPRAKRIVAPQEEFFLPVRRAEPEELTDPDLTLGSEPPVSDARIMNATTANERVVAALKSVPRVGEVSRPTPAPVMGAPVARDLEQLERDMAARPTVAGLQRLAALVLQQGDWKRAEQHMLRATHLEPENDALAQAHRRLVEQRAVRELAARRARSV